MARMQLILAISGLLSPALAQDRSGSSVDILSYVNPLIGSVNGGNVFAGASRPYGLAKAVADVTGQNTAGFSTDGSLVTGFSSAHDAGTGGQPSLGNFPLFPELCPADDINNCVYSKEARGVNYDLSSVVARPGYFSLALQNGIKAEMSTGERAALYRFRFPNVAAKGSANGTSQVYGNASYGPPADATNGGKNIAPLILLDLTDLSDSRQNASISIDSTTGRMTGNGTFLPSFGVGSYVMHFCTEFSSDSGTKMRDNGVHVNFRAGTQPKSISITRGINLFYYQAGGYVRFEANSASNETVISVRQGISFVSVDQACKNMENDVPATSRSTNGTKWDIDGLIEQTQDIWRKKLSVISITPGAGVNSSYLTNFYSAFYRTMLNPQNLTGENPHLSPSKPYFDSFYCIWDQFRAQLPFLSIVDPSTVVQLLNALLNIYDLEGWLPDCRMSLSRGFTQGGSNADVVMSDAYVKNITKSGGGNVDWNKALAAVVKDAESEPYDWATQGRGGLQSWHKLGYIPFLDFDFIGFGVIAHSISRTLEYAYNDFCVGQIAKGLGLSNYTTYLQRSFNWRNILKLDQTATLFGKDTGFKGYYQPKYANGTWGFQDPIECASITGTFCSLTSDPSETFESSIWEYTFYVPHAFSALINLLGGAQSFTKRLDYFYSSGLLDISNEPSFLSVYAYHYVGRPALSAVRVHSFIPAMFNTTLGGLPGNDDSGAMASFTLLGMMGLFPNAGQNVYLIIPPFFESLSFRSPVTGRTATIKNVNFDAAYRNIYIQSAKLNGQTYTKSWIGHEFFHQGMTLELTLGSNESAWGTKQEDLPPSLDIM